MPRNQPFIYGLFFVLLIFLFVIHQGLILPIVEYTDELIYYREGISLIESLKYKNTFGHPPLFSFLINLGPSVIFARYSMLVVSLSLLLFCFHIGREKLTDLGSLLFALNLGISPIYFTHSDFMIPNFFLALLFGGALWALIHEKRPLLFTFIALSLLTRESALALLVTCFILDSKRRKYQLVYGAYLGLVLIHFIALKFFFNQWTLNEGYLNYLDHTHSFALKNTLVDILFYWGSALPFCFCFLVIGLIDALKKISPLWIFPAILTLATSLVFENNWSQLPHFLYLSWRSFPFWKVWLGVISITIIIKPFNTRVRGFYGLKREEGLIIKFGFLLSLQFIAFFSLYGDTYIRDVIAYTPYLLLSSFFLLKHFYGKYILYLMLLFCLLCNGWALMSPITYDYPMNFFSRTKLLPTRAYSDYSFYWKD